jgi:hypothetical protein
MARYSYKKALGILTEWAYKEGYTDISFDHNDVSYIDWVKKSLNTPKVIKIEGKYSIEIKVYLLLHELGHHQLRKDWVKFRMMLPISANAEQVHFFMKDSRLKKGLIYDVSCMEEEFKAWEEGFKLGVTLGIKINEKKWHEFKSKCLMSYMRHFSLKNIKKNLD